MTTRVLLDEGVPRQLAEPLEAAGLSVSSYPNSWKQITNGELLALAAQREARHIDEQLFLETYATPSPAQAKIAAGRRR